jgi:hypothetical protein
MLWWMAALWGLLGGGLLEVLDHYTDIKKRGAMPWCKPYTKLRDPERPAPLTYAIAATLRLLMACGVAAASGASAMVLNPWAGIWVGVSAPLILQRFATQPALDPAGHVAQPVPNHPPNAPVTAETSGPGKGRRRRTARRAALRAPKTGAECDRGEVGDHDA